MSKNVMSDELFNEAFRICYQEIMDNRFEGENIICCLEELKGKVFNEMAENREERDEMLDTLITLIKMVKEDEDWHDVIAAIIFTGQKIVEKATGMSIEEVLSERD